MLMIERLVSFPNILSITTRDLGRFWNKVDRKGPDDCWEWSACRRLQGYGAFKLSGQIYLANRVAYFLTHGIDPGKMFVLHSCHNPPCCNPAHLRLGTHSENMREMCESGRGNQRYQESRKSFRESDIPIIRARREAGETYRSIAKDYGVHLSTIYKLANGESYAYVQ